MTISTTCPECGVRHRLTDAQRGQRVCCSRCQTEFAAPHEDDSRTVLPAAAPTAVQAEVPDVRRRDARSARPPSVKKGNDLAPLYWLLGIAGLILLAVLLTCAGIIYRFTVGVRRVADEMAEMARNPPVLEVQPGPGGLELFPRQPADLDEALIQLKDREPSRRQGAASWLERQPVDPVRRPEVARALEPLLEDVHASPRVAAVRALEKWGGRDNVPALIRLLDSDPGGFEGDECRRRSTDMIVRLRDARGAAAIARHFKHPFEREQTRRALEALGPDAETAVWPYLKDTDWGVRVEACRTLKRIGTRRSLPQLEATLAATEARFGGSRSVADSAREAINAIKSRP